MPNKSKQQNLPLLCWQLKKIVNQAKYILDPDVVIVLKVNGFLRKSLRNVEKVRWVLSTQYS